MCGGSDDGPMYLYNCRPLYDDPCPNFPRPPRISKLASFCQGNGSYQKGPQEEDRRICPGAPQLNSNSNRPGPLFNNSNIYFGSSSRRGQCCSKAPPVFISNGTKDDSGCCLCHGLKTLDVQEDLSYYPQPQKQKGKKDHCCGCCCFGLCDCCGRIQCICCEDKKEKRSNNDEPIIYTRRQRFSFRDCEGKVDQSTRVQPWPFNGKGQGQEQGRPQERQKDPGPGRRKDKECFCGIRTIESFDEIPVGKNPRPPEPRPCCGGTQDEGQVKDQVKDCEEKLPKKSGVYYYSKTTDSFQADPQVIQVSDSPFTPPPPPPPVIVEEVRLPPPPPPPEILVQPVLQPMMYPSPAYFYCNPYCCPCPCPPPRSCCHCNCSCSCSRPCNGNNNSNSNGLSLGCMGMMGGGGGLQATSNNPCVVPLCIPTCNQYGLNCCAPQIIPIPMPPERSRSPKKKSKKSKKRKDKKKKKKKKKKKEDSDEDDEEDLEVRVTTTSDYDGSTGETTVSENIVVLQGGEELGHGSSSAKGNKLHSKIPIKTNNPNKVKGRNQGQGQGQGPIVNLAQVEPFEFTGGTTIPMTGAGPVVYGSVRGSIPNEVAESIQRSVQGSVQGQGSVQSQPGRGNFIFPYRGSVLSNVSYPPYPPPGTTQFMDGSVRGSVGTQILSIQGSQLQQPGVMGGFNQVSNQALNMPQQQQQGLTGPPPGNKLNGPIGQPPPQGLMNQSMTSGIGMQRQQQQGLNPQGNFQQLQPNWLGGDGSSQVSSASQGQGPWMSGGPNPNPNQQPSPNPQIPFDSRSLRPTGPMGNGYPNPPQGQFQPPPPGDQFHLQPPRPGGFQPPPPNQPPNQYQPPQGQFRPPPQPPQPPPPPLFQPQPPPNPPQPPLDPWSSNNKARKGSTRSAIPTSKMNFHEKKDSDKQKVKGRLYERSSSSSNSN